MKPFGLRGAGQKASQFTRVEEPGLALAACDAVENGTENRGLAFGQRRGRIARDPRQLEYAAPQRRFDERPAVPGQRSPPECEALNLNRKRHHALFDHLVLSVENRDDADDD